MSKHPAPNPADRPSLTKTVTLLPASARVIPDVVRTLFPEAGEAAGALEVDSVFGLLVLLVRTTG